MSEGVARGQAYVGTLLCDHVQVGTDLLIGTVEEEYLRTTAAQYLGELGGREYYVVAWASRYRNQQNWWTRELRYRVIDPQTCMMTDVMAHSQDLETV